MEKSEISIQEVRAYLAMSREKRWMTNNDLAKVANLPARTARAMTKKFVNLRLVDLQEVWPSHRYKWSELANKRNQAYLLRLQAAAEAFGL